jgi:hypothetical protein
MAKIPLAARFAHLLGNPTKPVKRTDDDLSNEDRVQKDGESNEDYASRMSDDLAHDDDDRQADDESADDYAARMKTKYADDTDAEDADGKDKEAKARRAGATAERARGRQIFAHKAAAGQPHLAATLAFDTDLKPDAAIAILTSAASTKTRGGGLAAAMASVTTNVPNPGDGGAAAPSARDPRAIAQKILDAGKKARGEV